MSLTCLRPSAGDSECVNRDDEQSCDLEAILGRCKTNPSYALRFCAGSCRDFIDVCASPGVQGELGIGSTFCIDAIAIAV